MNLKIERNQKSTKIYSEQIGKNYAASISVMVMLSGILVFFFWALFFLTENPSLFYFAFLMFFLSLVYTNLFGLLWAIFGTEIIDLTNEEIRITKKVWKLKHSKRFQKSNITEIKILDSSNSFGAQGHAFFGTSNIWIVFIHRRKKRSFGKHLNQDEAKLIMEEFRQLGYTELWQNL